jgi:hypothetical protein
MSSRQEMTEALDFLCLFPPRSKISETPGVGALGKGFSVRL